MKMQFLMISSYGALLIYALFVQPACDYVPPPGTYTDGTDFADRASGTDSIHTIADGSTSDDEAVDKIPVLTPSTASPGTQAESTASEGTPAGDTPADATPTTCTDEMMASLNGCTTIATHNHRRWSCDCTNQCMWDECMDECMGEYDEAVDACHAKYGSCGELVRDSAFTCWSECADDQSSCVAQVQCVGGTDTARCWHDYLACTGAC